MATTLDIFLHSVSHRNVVLERISSSLQEQGGGILVDRHDFSKLFGYINFCDGTRIRAEEWFNGLASRACGQLRISYASRYPGSNDLLHLSVG